MPRKPNYDYEKRQKELQRKAKRDGKREERRQQRELGAQSEGAADGQTVEDASTAVPSDE